MVGGALCDLTAAYVDQDELLLELVRVLRTGPVDRDRCNQVEQIASRSTPEALRRTAQEVVDAILQARDWVYDGLKLLRLLNAPTHLQRSVVGRLLDLFQEPDAPWGTIGEEVANLEATDSQRSAAAENLLSRLRDESENGVKLSAARILALLRPDENQRQEALSILRDRVPTLDGRDLGQMIAVLGALGPGGTLDAADLRLILEQLESHRLDGSSLGFSWARTLVDLGRPDSEVRKRLIAATLIPAARLEEVGFISFNDRLIDAGILAGDHEAPKRLVGEAFIEVLRKGVEGFRNNAPVLEPHDLEVILDRFSDIGIPRDQQEVGARFAAALPHDLILHDQDQLRATRICSKWRALDPPENLIRQLAELLIEAIRNPALATTGRTRLLLAVLELEPSPEQRLQVAEIIVDEILASNERLDSYIVGRVTITADERMLEESYRRNQIFTESEKDRSNSKPRRKRPPASSHSAGAV